MRRIAHRRLPHRSLLRRCSPRSGCGFQLARHRHAAVRHALRRGAARLAVRNAAAARDRRRQPDAHHATIRPKPTRRCRSCNELREKEILSLSAGGRVRELQLRYRVQYQVFDRNKVLIAPPGEIVLRRDYSFNDQEQLSKESEEALLYRDMQTDAVQQLVRRLQAAAKAGAQRLARADAHHAPSSSSSISRAAQAALHRLRRRDAARARSGRPHPRRRARAGLHRARSAHRRAGLQVERARASPASSQSLFASRKLLELRIPNGKPGTEGSAALQAYCERLPRGHRDARAASRRSTGARRKRRWFEALDAAGVRVEARVVTRKALPQWLAGRLKAQKQDADAETLEFIADRVEGNLMAAYQEVQKLALLFPPGTIGFDAGARSRARRRALRRLQPRRSDARRRRRCGSRACSTA